MKRILQAVLVSIFWLSATVGISAAQTAEAQMRIEQVDSTAHPSVVVRLSAWDASGVPFANLSTADFTLQEDDGASFPPEQLSADSRSKISVALALDISGSMQGQPLNDARSAAARFLDRLTPGDQAALIAFSDPIDPAPTAMDDTREAAFTDQLTGLYDRVDGLRAAGGTRLYDALSKSVRMTAQLPQGRRAVLLLSDGRNEPANQGNPEEAIQLAKEAHIPIFVIGLGSEIDEPYLRRVAFETGGAFRVAPRSSELARLFEEMAALLKTEYQLSYTSTLAADGQEHRLAVRLEKKGFTAQAETILGPLPKAPQQTATIEPFPMPPPSSQPVSASGEPAPPAAPTIPARPFPWSLVGAGLITAGILAGTILRNRRKSVAAEVCAKCGFDLSRTSGTCPQCGETRRLPKTKR